MKSCVCLQAKVLVRTSYLIFRIKACVCQEDLEFTFKYGTGIREERVLSTQKFEEKARVL